MTEEQKLQIIRLRNEGYGYTTVATKLGVPKDTVKSFCRRNGLNGKAVQATTTANIGSICRKCGKAVVQETGKKQRVFCSDACRTAWWRAHPEKIKQRAVYSFTCAYCNQLFTAYGNSKRKYCSHECYIRNRFNGLRTQTPGEDCPETNLKKSKAIPDVRKSKSTSNASYVEVNGQKTIDTIQKNGNADRRKSVFEQSGEVVAMGKEEFRAEKIYQISIHIAKSMQKQGIISEEDYTQIDTILLEEYRPILGTLLAGKPLT